MAIQPVKGTVQGPSQSANRCPCCTFRASFPALGKSTIDSTYGIQTAGSCQEAGSCSAAASFFLRVAVLSPSPTLRLPCRKLALPRGRRLHNGLWDVGVERPSSSCWQHIHTAGLLPCIFYSRETFVRFGLAQHGRAQLVRGRACCCQKSDFEKILCQNVRHDVEAFLQFYAPETPILKNLRNGFRIGAYLRPKMNIQIREHIGMTQ